MDNVLLKFISDIELTRSGKRLIEEKEENLNDQIFSKINQMMRFRRASSVVIDL